MAYYESMDYQLTGCAEPEDTEMCCMIAAELEPTDTEMCCMIAAELAPTDAEMTEQRVYRPAAEADESDDEPEDEGEIPTPPPLVRQAAVTGPIGRQGMTLREQEIRFIEEHGLVAFCHGALVTAILQDADYLRAQLVYLRR